MGNNNNSPVRVLEFMVVSRHSHKDKPLFFQQLYDLPAVHGITIHTLHTHVNNTPGVHGMDLPDMQGADGAAVMNYRKPSCNAADQVNPFRPKGGNLRRQKLKN